MVKYAWSMLFGNFVIALLFILLIAFVDGFLVWMAWNYVVPSLFGLRPIEFLESYALSILASCFFKSRLECKGKK